MLIFEIQLGVHIGVYMGHRIERSVWGRTLTKSCPPAEMKVPCQTWRKGHRLSVSSRLVPPPMKWLTRGSTMCTYLVQQVNCQMGNLEGAGGLQRYPPSCCKQVCHLLSAHESAHAVAS